MYGLLTLEVNWADEFDVCGFRLLEPDDYDKYIKFASEHPEFFNQKTSFWFGTNQEIDNFKYKSVKDVGISETEFRVLVDLLDVKYGQYGHFPYILDDINEYMIELGYECLF